MDFLSYFPLGFSLKLATSCTAGSETSQTRLKIPWKSRLEKILVIWMIPSWNPKQPVFYGCFNWMIPNHFIKNGCFTKHPLKHGCLGYQVGMFPPTEGNSSFLLFAKLSPNVTQRLLLVVNVRLEGVDQQTFLNFGTELRSWNPKRSETSMVQAWLSCQQKGTSSGNTSLGHFFG